MRPDSKAGIRALIVPTATEQQHTGDSGSSHTAQHRAAAMADAQAKKILEEIERLEMDLKTLEGACTTSEAAKKIAEYCQSTADPFLGENDGPNPWQQSGQGGGGCTIL